MIPDRDFTIVRTTDAQKPTIANLVQLYLYDMTDEGPFPVGADGRFEYDFLDRFWQHPYQMSQFSHCSRWTKWLF